MTPGYQAVQSVHAAIDFCVANPGLAGDWHTASNTLALLSVPDERALTDLWTRLQDRGYTGVLFYEPDVDEHTALCVEPAAAAVLKRLPLALKG